MKIRIPTRVWVAFATSSLIWAAADVAADTTSRSGTMGQTDTAQLRLADGRSFHYAPGSNTAVRGYTKALVSAKTQVVGYAELAKTQFKAASPDYIQAQKLYIDAQSKYAGWLASLEEAIRQGALKDLPGDADFQKSGDAAAEAAGVFVRYVDDHTAQSKGAFSWIGDAIDAGIKIWKEVKGEITTGRDAVANRLHTQASWPSWNAIGAAAQNSEPTDKSEGKPKNPS
jgi:hypothetical protein